MGCDFPKNVEIAFVVDATGSMQDEIDYLKSELENIIHNIKDTLPALDIRLASVFYRDIGDEYVTKKVDFSSDISRTINFIKANNAGGGGDEPEAVDQALSVTLNNLSWSNNALSRMVFLVLDAPPHNTPIIRDTLKMLIQAYAAKGIRIIPVACSGINKSAEYLMRSFSLLTNGSYVFLTDHSGIGGSHIKPSTDKYDVTLLNSLLKNIIIQNVYTPGCNQIVTTATDTSIVINPAVLKDSTELLSNELKSGLNDKATDQFKYWKYYPNPTTGNVTVEIEGQIGFIYMTDLSGKILERYEVNSNPKFNLDFSKYPTGVYLIKHEYKPGQWLSGKILLIH